MATTDIAIGDVINQLIDVNTGLPDRLIGMEQKLEGDLFANAGSGALQGETEELLRMILESADKALETMLSLQEQLQTRIIESYFPAQD